MLPLFAVAAMDVSRQRWDAAPPPASHRPQLSDPGAPANRIAGMRVVLRTSTDLAASPRQCGSLWPERLFDPWRRRTGTGWLRRSHKFRGRLRQRLQALWPRHAAHRSVPPLTFKPLQTLELLIVLVLVGLLALAALTLADYAANSGEYRFGTEVAGWAYRSPDHYLAVSVAQFALPAIGLVAGLFTRQARIRCAVRGIMLALAIAVLVLP